MSAATFSGTNLPPLVRVSNSVDAPVRVAALTAPRQSMRALRIIAPHVVLTEVHVASAPQVAVKVIRGRRARRKKQDPVRPLSAQLGG